MQITWYRLRLEGLEVQVVLSFVLLLSHMSLWNWFGVRRMSPSTNHQSPPLLQVPIYPAYHQTYLRTILEVRGIDKNDDVSSRKKPYVFLWCLWVTDSCVKVCVGKTSQLECIFLETYRKPINTTNTLEICTARNFINITLININSKRNKIITG